METEFNLSEKKVNNFIGTKADIVFKKIYYPEEDVKEFIRLLKEFVISRNQNLEMNKNNPRMNWKTAGTTELSNVLFQLDKLAGDKLK